jgi:sodium transport system permease protein
MIVGVVGANVAPPLMAYLAEQQIVVAPAPPDPVAAVQSGRIEVVLVVPQDYAEQLATGQPVQLRLVADRGRTSSDNAREYVSSALLGYGQRLARARLLALGLDPTIQTGVQVSLEDVSRSAGSGAFERAEAPIVILAIILTFGLTSGSLAIQLTAGERERRTMEPLLNETNRRAALVLGKTGAALAFGLLSSGLILLGLAVAVASYVRFDSRRSGCRHGTSEFPGLLLVAPPVAVLQMAVVAAFAGSADAASNRDMLLTLALTGIAVLTVSAAPYGALPHALPVVGALALTGEILLGQPPGFVASAFTLLSSVATVVLGLWLVTRLYEREAIVRS